MSQPPRGLGKGLGAILGNIPDAEELRNPSKNREATPAPRETARPVAGAVVIPLGEIEPNPYQPRQTFDREELDGLAASIASLGLITPITVRKSADHKYQIISGERRFRACQMAGLTEIPAFVREADDQGMLEMAIVENIQRADLDPIEVALSYRRLMDECNLTQEAMSERLGKSRPSVANQLRLLNLPVKVQHDLKVGQISVGHAKVLLSLDDPDTQVRLCDMVVSEGLNVRQLEEKVAAILSAKPKAGTVSAHKKVGDVPQIHKDLCREVAKYFKGEIRVKRKSDGKGTLTISFDSDEEINGFLDALKK